MEEVVDFIDLQWWPIFNFADMALVIGLPLLLYYRYQVERNLAMVEDKVRYHLSPHHDGERVDRVIAFFSGLSRSKVSDLISKRLILRNGIPIKRFRDCPHER